ncbi:MAG: hypothetical protein KKF26_02900 [Chloroflexi bacterium]|nr:hypothetical protein [Chloroflexota bacterium]
MQRSKEEIIDYFQEFIFGFIYHDIERCIEVQANYAVALALLSYTEYIGGLISGNLGEKKESENNFNRALKHFPHKYQGINKTLKAQYVGKNGKLKTDTGIYKLFRCGMVHEYFIKGLGTIINNPDGQAAAHRIGIDVMEVKMWPTGLTEKLIILYTNEYFRDFRLAVNNIYKKLIIDSDVKLLDGFNKSLDRINARKIL